MFDHQASAASDGWDPELDLAAMEGLLEPPSVVALAPASEPSGIGAPRSERKPKLAAVSPNREMVSQDGILL
jgi:hypothetical protein